jgi:hypothetical protein
VEAELPHLTEDERRWAIEAEALWRRAMAIAERHPGMDVSGVYHVLWNLRRPIEERIRRGLILDNLRPERR